MTDHSRDSTLHAYTGPERREPVDCEAGRKSWAALNGDGERQGVFEQLRLLQSLVHELRTSARLVVLFAGVIAVCTVWSVISR